MNTQVSLSYDIDKIKQHYAVLAARLIQGWYQDRRFLVLPDAKEGLLNSIIFPRTDWIMDKQIRKKIERLPSATDWKDLHDAGEIDYRKIDLTEVVIENSDTATKRYQEVLTVLPEVIEWWEQAFPFNYKQVKIVIYPIKFGTRGTFYRLVNGKNLLIEIFPRQDSMSISLIWSLVATLVIDKIGSKWESEVDTWRTRQSIVDFLVFESKLSKYMPDTVVPLIDQLVDDSSLQVDQKQKSNLYLQELRLPLPQQKTYHWDHLHVVLSESEFIIAERLHRNASQVVEYDRLAQALYGEQWAEKFSLEYLAKVVEGIRKKFKQMGYAQTIFTKRGVGYGWFE